MKYYHRRDDKTETREVKTIRNASLSTKHSIKQHKAQFSVNLHRRYEREKSEIDIMTVEQEEHGRLKKQFKKGRQVA